MELQSLLNFTPSMGEEFCEQGLFLVGPKCVFMSDTQAFVDAIIGSNSGESREDIQLLLVINMFFIIYRAR